MQLDLLIIVGAALLIAALMFYLGWALNSKITKNTIDSAKENANRIIEDAEKESKNIKREKLLEVKDEWLKKKQEFDNEVNNKRQKLQNYEKQLSQREENIEKKVELVNQKEKDFKVTRDHVWNQLIPQR